MKGFCRQLFFSFRCEAFELKWNVYDDKQICLLNIRLSCNRTCKEAYLKVEIEIEEKYF